MDVYLEGKKLRLDPTKALGKGGEADVFDLGDGRVLKLFKPPEHPDYDNLPHEQTAARARIAEHQHKLPAFPRPLPARVVSPETLATDRKGKTLLGYAMRKLEGAEPLRRFGDPAFRRAGVPSSRVAELFRGLHRTLSALHGSGVVVGDFNDLNILVTGNDAWLIDADSFQFGPYLSTVFTERFLDPLRLGGSTQGLMPSRPASPDSDWYAFAVALMQSLLCVGPHGGIHRPKPPAPKATPTARVLQRITVFHPDVQYPKPATPFGVLPDDLLHCLHRVFVEDARGPFPLPLLDSLRFSVCASCGVEHARASCPTCRPSAPLATTPVTTVRGQVVATRLFTTEGVILHACVEDGTLRWLFHADGAYRREEGSAVLQGAIGPRRCTGPCRAPSRWWGRAGSSPCSPRASAPSASAWMLPSSARPSPPMCATATGPMRVRCGAMGRSVPSGWVRCSMGRRGSSWGRASGSASTARAPCAAPSSSMPSARASGMAWPCRGPRGGWWTRRPCSMVRTAGSSSPRRPAAGR